MHFADASNLGRITQGGCPTLIADARSPQNRTAVSASVLRPPGTTNRPTTVGELPRPRPISSFMISFDPVRVAGTRVSRHARASRYSFTKP